MRFLVSLPLHRAGLAGNPLYLPRQRVEFRRGLAQRCKNWKRLAFEPVDVHAPDDRAPLGFGPLAQYWRRWWPLAR